ncbi:MAG: trypsin-like peptidase domain-containing protein [Acidobacteria bacterium]|nr:trypsin-like peptidase domain-containing protein [Acidobacteriota bacterium]MBV9476922.1 trypsin-like peptidase domain-containing protein [Acidobacteriota bacterium]
MADLITTFRTLSPSIVAFGSKFARSKGGQAPPFPEIIGTGFVIDERGIVVTNRHVAEALLALPSAPNTSEPAAFALVYGGVYEENGGHALNAAPVDIIHYQMIGAFKAEKEWYGDPLPDAAFLQLKVRGLKPVTLATDHWSWEVGTPVATAGFAIGAQAMVIYGNINQMTPILRQGVIASVFPFPCPTPHGFTIDIMTLGGESGSPIFRQDRPEVVGLLHAGFDNTNITLALPSLFVAEAYKAISAQNLFEFSSDVPTLDALFEGEGSSGPEWTAV